MDLLNDYKTVIIMDDKGRVTIPAEVRKKMNLERGVMLEMVVTFDVIMLYIKSEEEKK